MLIEDGESALGESSTQKTIRFKLQETFLT